MLRTLIPNKPKWFRILWIVNALNFLAFYILAQVLGGDAISGHVTEGQYFLANGTAETQVSASIYKYSEFHTRITYILFPITLILWAPIVFLNYQMNKS